MKRWIVVDKKNNVFVSDFIKNERFVGTTKNCKDIFIFNWEHEAESSLLILRG